MRTKFYVSVVGAVFCTMLAGCTGSPTDTTASQLIDPATVVGDLVITNSSNDSRAIESLTLAGEGFAAEYPNVSVTYIHPDRNTHRDTIIQTLQTNAPDVVAWYPGNRMQPLIDENLLDDISDIWTANNLQTNMRASALSITRNGKKWGIPVSTYGWGVYYRKDIFETLGITEPSTWEEFQAVAQTLKTNGITPLTIGTEFLWPTAGVFDYLNLRINGFQVHNALTAGDISFTDERIRNVFVVWKDMIDNGYFIEGHQNMSWSDAVTPMVNGDAAMYIMGNFMVREFSDQAGSTEALGYFQFPQYSADISRAEEAPSDALFIPSNANNKNAARAFLSFVSRAAVQSEWNKVLGQIPPHKGAELTDDEFVRETAAVVNSAVALSQFFDRDAPAEMAEAAFREFQAFMLDTSNLDQMLQDLEEVQLSVYPQPE